MKNTTTIALPLFLLIIIDGMSFGMTLPVLAPLLTKTGASILGAHASIKTKHLLFGLIMFLPPFAYFFGAPLVGYWSDRFGRKPVLTACLIATFVAYCLYVVSFTISSLGLLCFARLLGGFATGSQAVAQAAMSDISNARFKILNIGFIALAMTLGLLLGPLLGGLFSSLTLPFYLAASLALINLFLLRRFLKESHIPNQARIVNFKKAFFLFLKSGFNKKILFIFFLFEFAWSLYYQSMAVIGVDVFHLNQRHIGFLSTYIGLALSLNLIFLLRPLAKRFSLNQIIKISLVIGALSLVIAFFADKLWAQIILAIPITAIVATTYSSLISLLSNHNDAASQGLLMGLSDATLSLAFAITGFLSGWITIYHNFLPLICSGIALIVAWVLMK